MLHFSMGGGGGWGLGAVLTCFHSTVPEVGGDIERLGGMTPTPRPSKAALGLHPHNTVKCKHHTGMTAGILFTFWGEAMGPEGLFSSLDRCMAGWAQQLKSEQKVHSYLCQGPVTYGVTAK